MLLKKKDGSCCPEKFLHSCNPGLAKTSLRFFALLPKKKALRKPFHLLLLLRYVNNNSAKFVQKFQPEISAKIGKIIKNYLNSAMGQVEAELMID